MATSAPTEAEYQHGLIRRLKERFPGCEVIKNDPQHQQGILDLTIIWGRCWAMLESKRSRRARHRPNQDYWVAYYNDMSFASFVYPENEEEVLAALQEAFTSGRTACVPQS